MKCKNYYLDLLKKAFGLQKPLAKMFSTTSSYFCYDTGTNKILECGEEVYHLICRLLDKETNQAIEDFISQYSENDFLEAAEEIVEAIQSEKILSLHKASQFGLSGHFTDFKGQLKSSTHAINLEVSQECNLRCGYCVYQDHFKEKRNYSHEIMDFDVAKKAIDFLDAHNTKEEAAIGFYGGEPLFIPH